MRKSFVLANNTSLTWGVYPNGFSRISITKFRMVLPHNGFESIVLFYKLHLLDVKMKMVWWNVLGRLPVTWLGLMPRESWYWTLRHSFQVMDYLPVTVNGLSTTPFELIYMALNQIIASFFVCFPLVSFVIPKMAVALGLVSLKLKLCRASPLIIVDVRMVSYFTAHITMKSTALC